MAGLGTFGLAAFSEREFIRVAYAYGPPKSGITTLLASLLVQSQRSLRLDAAVVISNRVTSKYMGNLVPKALITNQPLGTVITKLIAAQKQYQASGAPLLNLAVVVDDWFPKDPLSHDELVNSIRMLVDFNIVLLIGTSDLKKIASLVPTTASHVFAARSNVAADAKQLLKHLFLICSDLDEFSQVWNAASRYEFLVGIVQATVGDGIVNPAALLRRYDSTYYVDDASSSTSPTSSGFGAGVADLDDAVAAAAAAPAQVTSLGFSESNQLKVVTALSDKR